MLTLGVDFAADPARTALCWILWENGRAEVLPGASCGADDNALLAAFAEADKVGIDAPFGWPDAFVEAIVAHRDGRPWPDHGANREPLRFRRTDIAVHERTHRWPLSVSSDRIGVTTMRLAGLLSRLEQNGEAVERDGSGRIVEVYPAAALDIWDLPSRGYKRKENRDARCRLLDAIKTRTHGWLTLPDAVCQSCQGSDDVLDAVIAALVARAAATGRCEPIPNEVRPQAQREGWIALPSANGLDELAAASGPPPTI